MSDIGLAKISPKWLCFGMGVFATALLAMFWMYPVLWRLLGGALSSEATNGMIWSTPLLFIASLMTGWVMLGFLVLLWPEIVIGILPEFLKKGLVLKPDEKPGGARYQFKHGRQFVLNSLAGRVLIWPPVVFVFLALMSGLFMHSQLSAWAEWLENPVFRVAGLMIPVVFIVLLLARVFTPGIFSNINRQPVANDITSSGMLPYTAWPFVWGLMTAIMVVILMSVTGMLPQPDRHLQTVQEMEHRNNNRARNPESAFPDGKVKENESERKDVSNVKWEQHFLELLGENHVPVTDAFSTPFATYFRIDQPGYIPSGKLGPLDKNAKGPKECEPDMTGSTNVNDIAAETTMDAAEAAGNVMAISLRNPNCPRDLGQLWSAGSYVYDAHGNQLAGFEFKDNIHAYVVSAPDGVQYLVFPQGGFSPKDNPAIKKLTTRFVFIRNDDLLGGINGDNDSKMKIEPYIPAAPDLPVTVSYEVTTEDDSSDGTENFLPDVEGIISAVEDIIAQTKRKTSMAPEDIFIISRAEMSVVSAEDHERRMQEVSDRIKRNIQASNATFIHLGYLPQACYQDTLSCELLNRRSTIIYTSEN